MAPKGKKSGENTATFEASTEQLEAIINRLDAEDINLEEALKAFEEGIKLCRSAQKALEQAEQQVNLLLEEDGDIVTEDISNIRDKE